MNERIEELRNQAWLYANDQVREFSPEFTMFYTEKFAELIVRECADKIRGNFTRHVTGSVRNTDFNIGLSRAISSIEEHFGVD